MTQHTPQELRRGYLYALAVLLIWSGFVVASRFSGRTTLTPYDVIALRYTMAGLGILPIWLKLRTPLFDKQKLMLSLTGAVGFTLFAFNGFRHAPASHAGILLQGCLPFSVAVIVYFVTGERPSRQRMFGLVLIALGVASMATEAFEGTGMSWSGDGMLVIASLFWAVYSVLLRRWNQPPMEAAIAVTILATLIYMPVYFLFLPKNFADTAPQQIAFIAIYQGLIVAIVQMICYTRSIAILGASRMAVITSGVPVLASIGAWVLLNEPISLRVGIGLGLVSLGAVASNVGIFQRYFSPKNISNESL